MTLWTQPPRWLEWPLIRWLRNPYVQMRIGALLLLGTTVAWLPLYAAACVFGDEPPIVFHLSMFAIWLTGYTLVVLTDVGEKVDSE